MMIFDESQSRKAPAKITIFNLILPEIYAGRQNRSRGTVMARSRVPKSSIRRIKINNTVLFVGDGPEPPFPDSENANPNRWNIDFVALRLGVTKDTVKIWAAEGKFDVYKIGPGAYEVDIESFHEYINKLYNEQNDVSTS